MRASVLQLRNPNTSVTDVPDKHYPINRSIPTTCIFKKQDQHDEQFGFCSRCSRRQTSWLTGLECDNQAWVPVAWYTPNTAI
ncbi:hypothetical protein BaRGS_00011457 [Batillaria attramentaria]|uniref:Uncharacterized protein n=1 Tax=Batillaria attramentaria TaxID=370345 RepID=A0ABD0LDY4_9CAEN